MNKMKHQIVGSELLKKLHEEGTAVNGEGEQCIIGYVSDYNILGNWSNNSTGFICEYSLKEGSFSDYCQNIVFFDYCPVCGKKLEIQPCTSK